MYNVYIQGKKNELAFTQSEGKISKGFFNKEPFDVNIVKIETNEYHLLDGVKSYRVKVIKNEGEVLTLKVNGHLVQMKIKTPLQEIIEGKRGDKVSSNSQILSTMPGKVVQLLVKEGDVVVTGQTILVLEAMKMENQIKANFGGRVKKVKVNPFDIVGKNDVLVEFEA